MGQGYSPQAAYSQAMPFPSIGSPAALYACAIAIERDAVARYEGLAARMHELGNEAAEEVFATLARLEAGHLETLLARTAGIVLPPADPLGAAGAENRVLERSGARPVLGVAQALEIALRAERFAQAFFERVLLGAEDPALRALAREMVAEESEHVALVERLMESNACTTAS